MEFSRAVKEATYKVLKTALENGLNETSNFIIFYGKCIREIRDSINPEETVQKSALKIFPDETRYLQKQMDIKYKYKVNCKRTC